MSLHSAIFICFCAIFLFMNCFFPDFCWSKLKSNHAHSEIEFVEIPMQRSFATYKYCCFCFSSNNIIAIPAEARTQCYIKKKIFISPGNRCCKTHLVKNRIYEEDLKLLKTHSNTTDSPCQNYLKWRKLFPSDAIPLCLTKSVNWAFQKNKFKNWFILRKSSEDKGNDDFYVK